VLWHIIYDNSRIFPNDCPSMFEDEEEHEERGTQQGMNPLAGTVKDGRGYNLLPDPNSGNFIVQQLMADDRPVDVEVWDAVGSRVYKAEHRFKAKRTEVRLGLIPPGNYLLKLNDKNGDHFTIKFTIL
jgi:hypothetical protein